MHCYFYIQLPLVNTPVQPSLSVWERSHFPPNSARSGAPGTKCSAYSWDERGNRKLFRFINTLRGADCCWLVSSWLMEWEGKLIYEATRWQAVKCTSCIKSCSVEGVCRSDVMLLWVCARIRKQLKLKAPLYNSARIHLHSSTNDSERILCLLAQV